jgi:hypothetical protein
VGSFLPMMVASREPSVVRDLKEDHRTQHFQEDRSRGDRHDLRIVDTVPKLLGAVMELEINSYH